MDLNQFLEIIRNMEPLPGRRFKPHRYLALLAVLDIIENQENPARIFYYNDDFKNYFTHYFDIYAGPHDRNKPFKPLFHLMNAGRRSGRNFGEFWFFNSQAGVEYAELDQELFEILSNKESGHKSREIVRIEIKKCIKAGRQTNP